MKKEKINLFFKKITNYNYLNNEIKWTIINFVFSVLLLIVCLSIIITSTNKNSNLVNTILVYAVYLPIAIISIVFNIIVSLSAIKSSNNDWYKKWYFYLPLASIILEALIIPILLFLINNGTINAGTLWSLLIFGFIVVILISINFIMVYKSNLNELSYVVGEEDCGKNKDEQKPSKQKDNSIELQKTNENTINEQ